jgi:hypothetical protein
MGDDHLEKHRIDLSKTDMRVLEKILVSSERLCSQEISKDFGERSGSHIHKSCKHLLNSGLLEPDYQKNVKNAQKILLQPTLLGFCYFVSFSEIFSGFYEYPPQPEKIQEVCRYLDKWKHLDDGIGCFLSLFMYSQFPREDYEIGNIIITALGEACIKTIQIVNIIHEHDERTGKSDTKTGGSRTVSIFFKRMLLENILTLPTSTGFVIDCHKIVQTFSTSTCKHELQLQMEAKIREGQDIASAYKDYF